uniref:FtsX-like permease family protein n=1 Tax=Candidatus Kentrum sp. LPFa TaxID=2126335 RepID=A0A450XEU8_9GAMM|nr:MAG: hypothetical protein BECKLPF1236C_GA0070990_100535 [Candidatus Kentron sp. LPFa]
MWAQMHGSFLYCKLAYLRRRGSGAIYLSMAGTGALVWIGIAIRLSTLNQLDGSSGSGNVFDIATFDLMILGAAVAGLQSLLVVARLSKERESELKTFLILGLPIRLLLISRTWELWLHSVTGAFLGAIFGWFVLEAFAGWSGTVGNGLLAMAAALCVPMLAMMPVSTWIWWRSVR